MNARPTGPAGSETTSGLPPGRGGRRAWGRGRGEALPSHLGRPLLLPAPAPKASSQRKQLAFRLRGTPPAGVAARGAGAGRPLAAPSPSPAAERSGMMGKRTRLGTPKSRWMRSPLPAPNGWYLRAQCVFVGAAAAQDVHQCFRGRGLVPGKDGCRAVQQMMAPGRRRAHLLPSSPSKYDMFSTTATHGTCSLANMRMPGKDTEQRGGGAEGGRTPMRAKPVRGAAGAAPRLQCEARSLA